MNRNIEHVRILSVLHYVVGGITALLSCLPVFHLFMGVMIFNGSVHESFNGEAPPEIVGWTIIFTAGFFILFGWTIAVCILLAGRKLARFQNFNFCLAVAGIECILMPFGTVLGVFTIIVLMKDPVQALFAARRRA